MKNAIYFVAFQILILAIFFYSYFNTSNTVNKTKELANPLIVNEFSYSIRTEKGDEILISGKKLTKSSTVKVTQPRGVVNFSGNKDKLFFDADNLEITGQSKLTLNGNARLNTKDYSLITEILEFDNEKKVLSSPTKTTFHSVFATFKGASFVYYLNDKNLKLDKVEGRVWLKQS